MDDFWALEKISEVDESDDIIMSRSSSGMSQLQQHHQQEFSSRPQTNKAPIQKSQATLRGSSYHREDDDFFNLDDQDVVVQNNFLLTELGEGAYANESSDEDDDLKLQVDIDNEDELFMVRSRRSKHKPSQRPINFTEIENDVDYDTDLEEDQKKLQRRTIRSNSPKSLYFRMCENLNVIPCRYFLAHIDDQKLVLKYHQFTEDEIRALSKPLWNNFTVEKLHLDGNWILCDGVKYISRMIRKNDFITELSLADNKLGEDVESTREVCRMLTENCILRKLNLSGNGFSDKDIDMLISALEKNRLLKQLDLSHNQFGDESGKFLGQYISSNDTLEVLNISWNNFRNRAAKEIANGLKENVMLKKFDVSYNGFDMEGGKVLAEVVRNNSTIEKLNISSTRLNAECAASIANAIEHNDSLKILNVSNNPLTTSGALAIIYAIKLNTSCTIQQLDLSEIPVTKDFETVLGELMQTRPGFTCKHGPVISTSNTKSILYEGGKVDFEKIISSLKNTKVT